MVSDGFLFSGWLRPAFIHLTIARGPAYVQRNLQEAQFVRLQAGKQIQCIFEVSPKKLYPASYNNLGLDNYRRQAQQSVRS